MECKFIKIGIVDYGVGNYASIITSLKKLKYSVIISHDKILLQQCEVLILPGVGTFKEAIYKLNQYDLVNFLKNWATSGKPIIGICLGMHLLAEHGYEGGKNSGLGIIPGKVTRMYKKRWHIGWNRVSITSRKKLTQTHEEYYYFNHSFSLEIDSEFVIASVFFGKNIPSIVKKDSVIGVQFHPEKSQQKGLDLFDYLINMTINA
jgi:imidazole glycerol-phosphate synthase subunit HisH